MSDISSLSSREEVLIDENVSLPENMEDGEDDGKYKEEDEYGFSEYEEEGTGNATADGGRETAPELRERDERTAAAGIEEHMLEELVCENCLAGMKLGAADGLSLEEMTELFRTSGLRDSIRESKPISPPVIGEDDWKRVLAGGDRPPSISIGNSHEVDPDLSVVFDVDAFIAEAASFEAIRGFRFSYYPKAVQNLDKPLHVWYHGK